MRQLCLIGAVFAALTLVPGTVQGQEDGTIGGQVLDQSTNQPLVGVQMSVVGTNLGALTNQEGRFLIRNVPAGERDVRATLIGYSRLTQTVNVPAGGTADLDFTLRESAIELEGVVVTATGQQQRRREVGSTVANISVEDVNLAPVSSFSQLLQSRAPGVSVLQSAGTTGTGARVRIRGSNSISLSNEPMLIVDGVQVDNSAESFTVGLGGQSISRLNDINPEDIANVEILKGPAASALYGTAAANGVIQITTKQGRSGTTQWNVYTDVGTIQEVTDYPANWQHVGLLLGEDGEPVLDDGAPIAVQCTVTALAAGSCESAQMNSFNPLEEVSPFRDGSTYTVGMNVRGGNDQIQYFVSAENENEDGIYESNWLERTYLRGNMTAALRDNMDFSLRTGYTNSRLSLPGNDNNTFGFIGAGLLGTATDNEVTRGFYAFPNERRFALERIQNLQRLVGSMDLNWRPLNWLTLTGTGGLDLMNRDDESGVAPNIWLPGESPDNAIGNRFVYAGLIRNYTGRANAIANYDVTEDISAVSSVGGEFRQDRFQRTDAGGYNLLPGTRSLGSLSERFSVNELDRTTRTVSGIFSQQLAWQDRIYFTGAVRGDRNSNFGGDFGFEWYPSLSASWVVAEEAWFPQVDAISSLRLRTAWGQSGLMPDFRSAEQFYSPEVARFRNVSIPAITIGGAGNPDLRPEQSTEYEFGFDLGVLDERLGVEVTYYNKESTDALVSRRLAPSLGSSATQWVNLGKVSNTGWEAQLNARLLNRQDVGWDATFNYGTNSNELVELGEGIEPIIFGIGADSQRHTEDYPLGSYFGTRIESWGDEDGNGVIGADEVELSDDPEFLGTPFPKRDMSLSTTLSLFNTVQLFALVDHKGGHQFFNSTEEFRCNTFFNCRGINDPEAPLWEQARAVAAGQGSIDGYVEDADFTKLREVSLTLMGLERLTQRAGLQGLNNVSLTVAGRNLATWTDYTGLDPELNSGGQSNFGTYEFLGQPPVRTWSVRLNVGF